MAPVRPGRAVAAAALAAVAAGLLLASVVVVLVGALDGTPAAGAWSRATGVVLTCALAAAGLLGALRLYRGAGRTLLLVTAGIGGGLVAATVAWSSWLSAGGPGAGPTLAGGVLVGALAALALTGAQVGLASSRPVGRWLEEAARVRASAPGRPRTGRRGTALAVVAPVAVLAVVTAGVVLTAAHPEGRDTDPTSPVAPVGELRGPVAPPAADDPGWSADFDGDAQDCFAGSMTACDDLYWESPVDHAYEVYGSTCGGRLARGTEGGCAAGLGARLN